MVTKQTTGLWTLVWNFPQGDRIFELVLPLWALHSSHPTGWAKLDPTDGLAHICERNTASCISSAAITMVSDKLETSSVTSKSPPTSQALSSPPVELLKCDVPSEDPQNGLTVRDVPLLFGSLWKEITIVLLCCCGPITQVLSPETRG